jgi:hypothetical protein
MLLEGVAFRQQIRRQSASVERHLDGISGLPAGRGRPAKGALRIKRRRKRTRGARSGKNKAASGKRCGLEM